MQVQIGTDWVQTGYRLGTDRFRSVQIGTDRYRSVQIGTDRFRSVQIGTEWAIQNHSVPPSHSFAGGGADGGVVGLALILILKFSAEAPETESMGGSQCARSL